MALVGPDHQHRLGTALAVARLVEALARGSKQSSSQQSGRQAFYKTRVWLRCACGSWLAYMLQCCAGVKRLPGCCGTGRRSTRGAVRTVHYCAVGFLRVQSIRWDPRHLAQSRTHCPVVVLEGLVQEACHGRHGSYPVGLACWWVVGRREAGSRLSVRKVIGSEM